MSFHFMAAATICSDFGAPQNKSVTVSTVSPSICHDHESRQIGSGQTGDGKSEHRHFRNQLTKMDWVNLTQMTIITTTVGRNPLEEME